VKTSCRSGISEFIRGRKETQLSSIAFTAGAGEGAGAGTDGAGICRKKHRFLLVESILLIPQIGFDDLFIGGDDRWRTLGQIESGRENVDDFALAHDKGHIMFDEKDGHPELVFDPAQEIADPLHLLCVHPVDRFIQQKNIRI
jgi:hypothetical protein